MIRTFDAFLDSIEKPSTRLVYRHYSRIAEYDLDHHSIDALKEFFRQTNFSSLRDYNTFLYTFREYAKYLEDMKLYKDLDKIDTNEIKIQIQSTAAKRLITHQEYLDYLHDIEMGEEFNELFSVTMIMCIYEGLFAENMATLANLRGQDVNGNVVTIRMQDGTLHYMEVSHTLAQNLLELASTNVSEQLGPHGSIITKTTEGYYPDSVFKIARRASKKGLNMELILYRRYATLKSEYAICCTPTQIFSSGIINRCATLCKEKHGLDFIEIFNDIKYRNLVNSLLGDELIRCRYAIGYDTFRHGIADNINSMKMKMD